MFYGFRKEGDPLIKKQKIWWFGKICVFLLNECKQVTKWTQTTWHYCPLDTDALCVFLVARHPRGVAGEDSKGTHRRGGEDKGRHLRDGSQARPPGKGGTRTNRRQRLSRALHARRQTADENRHVVLNKRKDCDGMED